MGVDIRKLDALDEGLVDSVLVSPSFPRGVSALLATVVSVFTLFPFLCL